MDLRTIDRMTKPYWDEKFNDSYIGEHDGKSQGWTDDWYGIIMKRPDGSEKLIVGHMSGDDNNMWFYDGSMFDGGEKLFNLGIGEFNRTMVRYINKKYNLEVKSVL
jgi:hypothetical protein